MEIRVGMKVKVADPNNGGYHYGIVEDIVPDMFCGELCLVKIKALGEVRTYKPESLKELKNHSNHKLCKQITQERK